MALGYSAPRFLQTIAVSAALIVLISAPIAAGHEDLYVLGLRAVDSSHWRQVSILISRAIEEQPKAGGVVRPYGTWIEPYVPHYYLGLARFHLHLYAGAMEAWQESRRQEPIHYRRNKRKLENLRELEGQIPGLVAARNEALQNELNSLLGDLARIEEDPGLAFRGVGRLEDGKSSSVPGVDSGEGVGVRREAVVTWLRRLEEASTGTGDLRDHAALQRDIEKVIASMRREVGGWTAMREIMEQERKRFAERNDEFRAAEVMMDKAGCPSEAIVVLNRLEALRLTSAVDSAASIPVDFALARAHLACGELAMAWQYLDLSDDRGLVAERDRTALRVETLAAGFRPEAIDLDTRSLRRWSAISDYLIASAEAGLGECRAGVLDRLAASRDELDGEMAEEGSLKDVEISYVPDVIEASAYLACSDVENASASLARAAKVGRASSVDLDRLTQAVYEMRSRTHYESSHALVLVGSDYLDGEDGWDDLPGAAEDGPEVAHALRREGFEVELIENPTSAEFRGAVGSFIARKGRKPSNRLLIYYAGHGWTEGNEDTVVGYVVPVDTPNPERSDLAFEHLVNMDEFEGWAKSIQAAHAMFVFDSCFGGTVFRTIEVGHDYVPAEVPSDPLKNNVKMFITAGQDHELVPDFSLFRRAFVEGLEGRADCNHDGMVVGGELGSHVTGTLRDQGAPTTPLWGRATDLGTGDVIFRSTREAVCSTDRSRLVEREPSPLEAEIRFWKVAWESLDRSQVRAYLERYPDGEFSAVAKVLVPSAVTGIDSATPTEVVDAGQ